MTYRNKIIEKIELYYETFIGIILISSTPYILQETGTTANTLAIHSLLAGTALTIYGTRNIIREKAHTGAGI